jgi:hypothetical protein
LISLARFLDELLTFFLSPRYTILPFVLEEKTDF